MSRQQRIDHSLIAEDQEPEAWMTLQRQGRTRYHHLRAMVAAHCVERDTH
jgi:hypothetical protein